jgi:hypothetical protein
VIFRELSADGSSQTQDAVLQVAARIGCWNMKLLGKV